MQILNSEERADTDEIRKCYDKYALEQKLVEECAELVSAINKRGYEKKIAQQYDSFPQSNGKKLNEHVIEEVADVLITLQEYLDNNACTDDFWLRDDIAEAGDADEAFNRRLLGFIDYKLARTIRATRVMLQNEEAYKTNDDDGDVMTEEEADAIRDYIAGGVEDDDYDDEEDD